MSMMDRKTAIFRKYASLIWPTQCPICGEILEYDGLLCDDCIDNLPYNDEKICPVCGKKQCLDHSAIHFDAVYTLVQYEYPVITAIYDLKDGLILNLAEYASVEIAKRMKADGIAEQVDLVTAVPMYWLKKEDKSINQAEAIARYMARELEKPYDFSLLKKKRGFQVQHKKSVSDRRAFADKVFYISPKHNDIKGKTVVLCDDVYTTGATLNSCTDLLKELGAEKVIVMAIANTEK